MAVWRYAIVPVILAATLSLPASAESERDHDPLRFFAGETVSVSTVKVLMRKSYQTTAYGTGKIKPDGTLELMQRVERAGEPMKIRRWTIRRIAPGRFSGTMTEAAGPVKIEKVDGRYCFRFKMKGNLSIEQWLTPQPNWRSATNSVSIKRFGIKVGSSHGTIRKVR